jgi:hypothetical protein
MHMNTNELPIAVVQVPPFCLNRQAAIAFSSFKPSFFDEHVRPRLCELRAGTSVLYLREELERVIREMFRIDQGADPDPHQSLRWDGMKKTNEGKEGWERRRAAYTKRGMAAGKSTSTSTGYDFESAFKALKTRRPG